jgi:hydrogenase assembly chaperone HypC/HupF
MCLTEPGLVVEVEPGVALVAFGDRRRRALTLLVPDVQVGDQVVVSAGAVVTRVDEDRATAMRDAFHRAAGRPAMSDRDDPHGTEAER